MKKPNLILSGLVARVKRIPSVSPPVMGLLIALTLVGVGILVLLRLHLLKILLASSAFQSAAFVLAVVAIVFAFIQFWDSRRHSSKIEQIAKSMSTRYIGLFPKDMDDIIELIRLADRELLIMCDFIDYGSYSKPKTHQVLFEALKKAKDKRVSVRCLIYGDEPALETLRSQFKESEFGKTRTSPQFLQYFEHWEGIKPRDADRGFTHSEFLQILSKKQEHYTNDLLDQGVDIGTLSEKLLLFFWLQDRQDAVFVFEDIGAEEKGLAFRTQDAKLVETFASIFERHSKSARPVGRTRPANDQHSTSL